MMIDVLNAAKYIVTICNKNNHPVSLTKLQNLLFLANELYVEDHDKNLFRPPSITKNGARYDDVYYQFCNYGVMPITRVYDYNPIDDDYKRYIDIIIAEFRDTSTNQTVKYVLDTEQYNWTASTVLERIKSDKINGASDSVKEILTYVKGIFWIVAISAGMDLIMSLLQFVANLILN